MGEWNWWAPKWLTRLHDHFGLDDGHAAGPRDQLEERGANEYAIPGVPVP
jgi:hypothetical protein